MEIDTLRAKNPSLKIFSVNDSEFSDYGRVISDIDVTEICNEAKKLPMPETGSVYHASEKSFEALPISKEVSERIFGTLPSQMGFCCGYSTRLNAAEWHSCSEFNVAVTPLVLMLGKRSDIKDGRLDSSVMKIFFLPAGCAVEIYSTTLHFCPCQTEKTGFRCVVGLAKGTNTDLDAPSDDRRLFRKNKWIIAHEENEALISRGVVPAIYGENYTIEF